MMNIDVRKKVGELFITKQEFLRLFETNSKVDKVLTRIMAEV